MLRRKPLPSAIHNFAHSFLSMMSWYDGAYTVDTIAEEAFRLDLSEVIIDWLLDEGAPSDAVPVRVEPQAVVTRRLTDAVRDYRARLPSLFESMGTSLDLLRWLRMRLVFDWTLMHNPLRCVMEGEDDQGRRYEVEVRAVQPHVRI